MTIRILLFISAFFVQAILVAQQVPNGNFESWNTTPWMALDPESWTTDNGQVVLSTYQDSAAYEGDWGMRVTPIQMGVGELGVASVQIPTDYIPPSLDFYAKWDRTATTSVSVNVTFYNGENSFYTESWYPEELSSAWTPISIQLNQIEPIMTHVIIEVGVFIGDFAPGEGWLAVDAMAFDGVNSVDDLESPSLGLFPNPSSDLLNIAAANSQSLFTVYDMMGKLLVRDTYQSGVDVSALPAGQYLIEIEMSDGDLSRSAFVVE